MLDQDEGHAVVGWQRAHELPAGVEAARRGAYSDNRKVGRAAKVVVAPGWHPASTAVGPLRPYVGDCPALCNIFKWLPPIGRLKLQVNRVSLAWR